MRIHPIHIILFLVLCAQSCSFTAQAQASGSRNVYINLSAVALLDIEPNRENLALQFTAPGEAGMPLTQPAVNTTKWLNYTSAKATSAPTRNISAQVDYTLPGIAIKLQAGGAVGGGGARGITSGVVTLNTAPQIIISGIGGAFTGNGAGNGHQLSIWAEVSDFSQLVPHTNQIITITYTISN